MKVCLINTPYKYMYGPIKTGIGCYFPIGLGYIASVLLKKGHKVIFLDPEAEDLNYEGIKS
ncbi:MAG: cobalamin B12-binding domain-containing protein, partial [Nanoarchaeota archaeon]|nr:cobalamin B12-binding domain-containing protein [Nanoarchaeota archaeon]